MKHSSTNVGQQQQQHIVGETIASGRLDLDQSHELVVLEDGSLDLTIYEQYDRIVVVDVHAPPPLHANKDVELGGTTKQISWSSTTQSITFQPLQDEVSSQDSSSCKSHNKGHSNRFSRKQTLLLLIFFSLLSVACLLTGLLCGMGAVGVCGTDSNNNDNNHFDATATMDETSNNEATNSKESEEEEEDAYRKPLSLDFSVHNNNNSSNNNNNNDTRVVGGFAVESAASVPFFAQWTRGCGASLIAPDLILTAAHCQLLLPEDSFANYPIVFGSTQQYYDGTSQSPDMFVTYGISQMIHPNYQGGLGELYDYMVVPLQDPVPPPLATVIALNSDPAIPYAGQPLDLVGFGKTSEFALETSPQLLQTSVNYVENCQEPPSIYQHYGFMDSTVHLCAASPGKDACQGDSGGPLYYYDSIISNNYVQVGITSWGDGCGRDNAPGVYARISTVYEWIRQQICDLSQAPPSHYQCDEYATIINDAADVNDANLDETAAAASSSPTAAAHVDSSSSSSSSSSSMISVSINLPINTNNDNHNDPSAPVMEATTPPTETQVTWAPITITAAPTTISPTTVAPITTEAPTTLAPTTMAPTTAVPTTAVPTPSPTDTNNYQLWTMPPTTAINNNNNDNPNDLESTTDAPNDTIMQFPDLVDTTTTTTTTARNRNNNQNDEHGNSK